jgi:hypothetical protein
VRKREPIVQRARLRKAKQKNPLTINTTFIRELRYQIKQGLVVHRD